MNLSTLSMTQRFYHLLSAFLLIGASALPTAWGKQSDTAGAPRKAPCAEEQQRGQSLRVIAQRFGVGPGAAIADIGAGSGPDTWVFADIVGQTGKVFAEEIDQEKTRAIEGEADKRGLSQVRAVLGKASDPSLPAESVDLAFMHHVYHHLTQPREMLQGIWKALKPGGHLVIVDQRLGTLVDWVPREQRAQKHYWIAETTVVREAREQGYSFVECAEQSWHAKDDFVLVFQRPSNGIAPDGDPDSPLPLPASVVELLLPVAGQSYQRAALVALGEGRKLIGPILDATGCAAVDIVPEEWATQRDERPPLPPGVTMPSVLTEKGDPHLSPEPIDAVYFLDSYHLLFHAPTLLAKLRQRLSAGGCVYILDRQAAGTIPRREASHRRMIAPETVKQEMNQAGFRLVREGLRPTDDRFLLVFDTADQPASGANSGEHDLETGTR